MNYEKRPKYITIERMTLETDLDDCVVLLDNTTDSVFYQVRFLGNYDNGGQPIGEDPTDLTKQTGIWSRSASGVHRPENVQFHSCIFNKTGYGFYSDSDHNNISFLECKFHNLFDAITMGGEVFGAVNTKVNSCYFDLVDRYGIYIKLGYGNTSCNNKYMLVGNNNESHANATYPILRFDAVSSNKYQCSGESINDFFERNFELKDQSLKGGLPFYPTVKTTGLVNDPTNFTKDFGETPSGEVEFFRFPLYNSTTYTIEYVLNKTTLGSALRTGTIHLTVDFLGSSYHIKDDFSYVGSSTVENIQFSASIEDYDGDFASETLVLKILNPTGNGTGTVNYSYHMMTR